MAGEKSVELSTKLITLLKQRAFVQQAKSTCSSNGASHGSKYIFGPAGVQLKRNINQVWWNWMITTQENTYPVESSLITNVERNEESEKLFSIRRGLSKDCYNHFKDISNMVGNKLPFTIVQTGLCHSSSAANWSGKFLLDSLVHTNLVSQHYCGPSDATKSFDHWMTYRLQWWRQYAGNPSKFVATEMQTLGDGTTRAFIQFEFPWGMEYLEAIVNKGDNPLKQLQDEDVNVLCKSGRKSVVPHVIECNTVLERAFIAYLFDAYTEKQKFSIKKENNKNQIRQVLQFNAQLAPYKVSIATSGSKVREIKEVASHLSTELKHAGIDTLDFGDDSSLTLENQIVRNDETGVQYTVIVNDSTLETGIVNCRDRDTTLKEQVHITKLKDSIILNVNAK